MNIQFKSSLFMFSIVALLFLSSPVFSIECHQIEDTMLSDGCSVTAAIEYSNEGYGKLPIKIYSSDGNTPKLKNVLILISSSDPQALLNADDWINILNNEGGGLATKLRSQGYDIVVIPLGLSSTDYVQKNAFALIRVFEKLDDWRNAKTPHVVVGFSIGGLIARYALAYMESEQYTSAGGKPTRVRTYISYDTPHNGANIPVAAQETPIFLDKAISKAKNAADGGIFNLSSLIAFISGEWLLSYGAYVFLDDYVDGKFNKASDAASSVTKQFLLSPSAKQTLINYYEPSGVGRFPSSHNLRSVLDEELESMGDYPNKTRNIAFANGSIAGINNVTESGSDLMPGFQYVQYGSNEVNSTNIWLRLHSTKIGSEVFYGRMRGLNSEGRRVNYITVTKNGNSNHLEIDSVPGSVGGILSKLQDGINSAFADAGFNQVHFNSLIFTYIPTTSALDIDQLRYDENLVQLNGGKVAELTPFDAVYGPVNQYINEFHVSLNSKKGQILYREITSRHDIAWMIPVMNNILF